MALKLKAPPKVKTKAPPPPKELTLEEAREQFEFGTQERAIAELKALVDAKEAARVLTNATNRQKTQAGKSLKTLIAEELLAVGDEIQIGDMSFRYDYATSESIDSRKLYDMVRAGKVPVEDFLKSIYINKEMASKFIGDHVLLPITSKKEGKTLDIRISELETPVASPRIVKKSAPPPKRGKVDRSIDQAPPGDNVSNAVSSIRRPRRLKLAGK